MLVAGHFFVVIHPVGVRVALHDRITGEENRPEQGGADLAHPAAHALDGLAADDDHRLGVAVIQADVAQGFGHREGGVGWDEQPVELGGGSLDVLDAVCTGAVIPGGLGVHQLGDAQVGAAGCIHGGRLSDIEGQRDAVLPGGEFLLHGLDGVFHVQLAPDDRALHHFQLVECRH